MNVRFIALMFACCLSLLSCGNRNPNLSKKQLLALENDTTQTNSETPETPAYVFPDTSYVPPAGAKYTEIRSIDPAAPPVTLKVSVPQGEKQSLKLSRFGSSVEYVVLRLPDENDFFLTEKFSTPIQILGINNYKFTYIDRLGDHFIASNGSGVRLFDPSGFFVQDLLMSEKADRVFEGEKFASMLDITGTHCYLAMVDFEGNPYNVRDFLVKGHSDAKFWAGEFDLAKRPIFTPSSELTTLTPGVELVPSRSFPAGMFMDDNTRFLFQRGRDPFAITFNNMGDTLCKFTNYADGNGGAYKSDVSFFYRADGALFFRHEFCDTVFRVQSANCIVPVYRFDFGAQRLSSAESASNKMQGKFIPYKWFVFKDAMLLIFSEGHDCPDCRARNQVTFHCLLFDKQTGKPTPVDMKSLYPENILIENDLDGFLPIPINSLRIQDGVIIATYTKSQIEEILKNNAGNINTDTASQMKKSAEELKQNEMLVMIIK